MDPFNAETFLDRIDRGDFDGHIHEEFDKLTPEQIEQVALLAVKQAPVRFSPVKPVREPLLLSSDGNDSIGVSAGK